MGSMGVSCSLTEDTRTENAVYQKMITDDPGPQIALGIWEHKVVVTWH
jgi:hypothetical protein